ncbi:hypothetical protein LSH36_37g06005 [Paralvinella palmiformis]|uniref:Uncharacterized protein n=1 Tax=Paralvinella palmiformis TaxID=53620 RepID=A0AAD9NFQ5_9ANNE|nr:hypothetical protein LSH36_37g06005 [Paralvinella palmiformis]
MVMDFQKNHMCRLAVYNRKMLCIGRAENVYAAISRCLHKAGIGVRTPRPSRSCGGTPTSHSSPMICSQLNKMIISQQGQVAPGRSLVATDPSRVPLRIGVKTPPTQSGLSRVQSPKGQGRYSCSPMDITPGMSRYLDAINYVNANRSCPPLPATCMPITPNVPVTPNYVTSCSPATLGMSGRRHVNTHTATVQMPKDSLLFRN